MSESLPPPAAQASPKPEPVNLCPNCGSRQPCQRHHCGKCAITLKISSQGALSFWMLGDIPLREVSDLAKSVEMALGVPVVVQPARLDPRPSERKKWHGRSGNVILRQLLERDTP
ncbi:MAG: hypothetical protein EOP86_17875, partial [Verrucomicrobiaceae bacterium]